MQQDFGFEEPLRRANLGSVRLSGEKAHIGAATTRPMIGSINIKLAQVLKLFKIS